MCIRDSKWAADNRVDGNLPTPGDVGIQLGTSGFFKDYDSVDSTMDTKLDNAPPTYKGVVFRIKNKGVYHYMCTRNNNFSNRSQKGSFVVS